jgi:hypothetical protein
MSAQVQVVLIAAGCSGAVGTIGLGAIWLLRRASLRLSLMAASAIAVLAVVAGTLGTANAMLLSQHDLRRSKLPLPGGATRGRRPGQAGRARPASRSAPVPVRALSHSADAPSDAAGFPDISTTPAYPPAWPASRAR